MDKRKTASSEGWLSIAVNIVLFGIKYWAGIATGSIAFITDAWHSLSDSISSLAIIIGAKIAGKPPDKQHPFGHGRAELITAIIIGMMLVLVGFNFLLDSVERLKDDSEIIFGRLSYIVIGVSIFLKEASAQYAFYTGRKTGYKSLKADGWHHRSDALSSIIILAGMLLTPYLPYTDSVMGILVSGFIFHTAYVIIKESADDILGTAPSAETIRKVTEKANNTAGFDLKVHNFKMHEYGEQQEISFHIRLPDEMRVKEAGELIGQISHEIYDSFGYGTTIHMNCQKKV